MERCSFGSYYEKLLATGEVKCIDEEIPFEIPQGWEWFRVSSLFQINPKVVAEDNTSAAFIPMEAIPQDMALNLDIMKRNGVKSSLATQLLQTMILHLQKLPLVFKTGNLQSLRVCLMV